MKKFLAVIMLLFSFSVFAEQYKVIVPYAAGATPDVQARKIFATVSKNTGDTFVVFNKGGAETLLGYKYFLEESSNDKNVLYISHTSYYNIFLNDDEKFSIDKNSKSVATIQKFTYSLVTRKDSTLEDISQIRGKLNIGGTVKLCLRALEAIKKDKDLQFISYTSDVDGFMNMLKGDLDLVCTGSNSVAYSAVKDKTKAIKNFNKEVNVGVTSGIVASKLMSDDDVKRLNAAINEAYKDEGLKSWFVEISGNPPEIGPINGYTKHANELKKFLDTHQISLK